MNADEIRELQNREPFEPFRFHLTSGKTFDIRDPNSVALGARRVFIAVAEPDRDHLAIFPYIHIAAIETLGNGTRPRRKRRS